MDAITAIRTRRSVRVFLDTPLDRATIEALLGDAAHAPFTPIAQSGAWHFTVIRGRERLAGYGDRALAFAQETRPQLRGYEWTERPGFSVFHGAPAAVVISGRLGLSVALEGCTRFGQLLDIAANARGIGAGSQLRRKSGWLPVWPHSPRVRNFRPMHSFERSVETIRPVLSFRAVNARLRVSEMGCVAVGSPII